MPSERVRIARPAATPARGSGPLGEREGREREQQEERLAVDGLEEERHREDGEVEHRAPRAVGAEPFLGEPVQQQERAEGRGERDDDPRQQVVADEDVAEPRRRAPGRAGGTRREAWS